MKNRRLIAIALMVVVVAIDQFTKWLIVNTPGLSGDRASIHVLPFFSLVHWTNKGVSFGMFNAVATPAGQRNILELLTLAIIGVLVYSLVKAEKMLTIVALGLIMGGAVGNLIDRIHYGAVTDFLYFHYRHRYDFPAFNVADSCVCIGVGLMLLDGLGVGRRKSVSFSDV